ncbi:MAG: cytochrome c [Gammaproteobacteria bacterium]|nr:cytochrome c [Gammaproteobacteria bacterium]
MQLKNIFLAVAVLAVASACSKPPQAEEAPQALAEDDPRVVRHELMEGVGDAAKVVGAMLKGEREYDAAAAAASLATFGDAAAKLGDLFPAGTETGGDTEAAPAIWEDRAGFDAALQDWADATAAAVTAAPATLEDAKPVLGAVFKTCKGCHDTYRIDDE